MSKVCQVPERSGRGQIDQKKTQDETAEKPREEEDSEMGKGSPAVDQSMNADRSQLSSFLKGWLCLGLFMPQLLS